jgi:hypothetical protein
MSRTYSAARSLKLIPALTFCSYPVLILIIGKVYIGIGTGRARDSNMQWHSVTSCLLLCSPVRSYITVSVITKCSSTNLQSEISRNCINFLKRVVEGGRQSSAKMLMRMEIRELADAVHINTSEVHGTLCYVLKRVDPQMVGGLNTDDHDLTKPGCITLYYPLPYKCCTAHMITY